MLAVLLATLVRSDTTGGASDAASKFLSNAHNKSLVLGQYRQPQQQGLQARLKRYQHKRKPQQDHQPQRYPNASSHNIPQATCAIFEPPNDFAQKFEGFAFAKPYVSCLLPYSLPLPSLDLSFCNSTPPSVLSHVPLHAIIASSASHKSKSPSMHFVSSL
jgi:hypothetical protein